VHVYKSFVTTEITIEVSAEKTVKEASTIAAAARAVAEALPGIDGADIHLELDDGGPAQWRAAALQKAPSTRFY
jgi:hypothetical protein